MKAILNRLLNITQKAWVKLWDTLAVPSALPDDDLSNLKDRVMQLMVASGLLLGLFALVPAIVIFYGSGLWHICIASILIYLLFAATMLVRTISYRIRAMIILSTLYGIGLWVILTMGIVSSGAAWLYTFAIVAGVLLGLRAAAVALFINVVTLIAVVWLMRAGLIAQGEPGFPSIGRAASAGVSFIFLNALSAFSMAELYQSLLNAISRARQSKEALELEVQMHKLTGSSLKESEEKYRLLAENISDVLWAMDMDLNVTYANPAARRMLGWTQEEVTRLRIEDLLTALSLEMALKVLANSIAAAEATGNFSRSSILNLDLRAKNGTITPTEVCASLIPGDKGKPIGIMGVARDISSRIKTDHEKEVLQEKLAHSKKLEALGSLAGGVAHDLNNILSGIVSYPDLMLIDLPQDSPMRKPLETIKQSGHEASEIVQDLLALARRNAKTDTVVCLNDVVNECLSSEEYALLMRRYANVITKTLPADDLLNIKGSPFHLEKVLMNLLTHAAESQSEGGVVAITTRNFHVDQPPIGLPHMESGDYIRMRVSDQGKGLSQRDLEHIFEPFYTRNFMGRSGTGLGMAVVWGVVQDHGGFITAHSQEGVGTHFDVYFPITRESVGAEPDEPAVDTLLGAWQTILVVDDVPEQREIAVGMLKRLRYYPLTAASGEEAVAHFKKRDGNPIDAVILDMVMPPGMDGLDTYREIIKLNPKIKVLIASGFPETDRVRKALDLGVGAYIKKPYMILEIGLVLKKLLASLPITGHKSPN